MEGETPSPSGARPEAPKLKPTTAPEASAGSSSRPTTLVIRCPGCDTGIRGKVLPDRLFEVRCPSCQRSLRFSANGEIFPTVAPRAPGFRSSSDSWSPCPEDNARENQRSQVERLRQAQTEANERRSEISASSEPECPAKEAGRCRRAWIVVLVLLTLAGALGLLT